MTESFFSFLPVQMFLGMLVISLSILVLPELMRRHRYKLHYLAARDDAEKLQSLLSQGWDVDALNNDKRTALEMAVNNCSLNSVKVLLSNMANVNRVNLHKNTVLHTACYACTIDMVKLLVGRGAKVGTKDDYGNTPLHSACEGESNLESVEFLLQRGVDINAKNNDNETALHIAVREHAGDIVAYLLEMGANEALKNSDGLTAQELDEDEEMFPSREVDIDVNNEELTPYIGLHDKTGFSANLLIVMGLIIMLIAYAVLSNEFLDIFIAIVFGGVGLTFFTKGFLDAVSTQLYGSITVFIDSKTMKNGPSLKGYIPTVKKTENMNILFTLQYRKHTSTKDMDGKTSSQTEVVWQESVNGMIGVKDGEKIIQFTLPIKRQSKHKSGNYSWEFSFKNSANSLFLHRIYYIDL